MSRVKHLQNKSDKMSLSRQGSWKQSILIYSNTHVYR